MKIHYTRNKIRVNVPETIDEDSTIRFKIHEIDKAKKYYFENGYVVFEDLIEKKDCDLIRNNWNFYIKKYSGKIYRQTSGKAEKNQFNKKNWIMNPVLNIQSLNPNIFGIFKKSVENLIFNSINLNNVLSKFLNDKPKIIQSMYFEGNTATEEHQDTYFLDSDNIGALTAAWVALEEIKADAGRFFVFSGSNKLDIKGNSYSDSILTNHNNYIKHMIDQCISNNMKIKAPYLNKGDVLFWNSKTIHGSLDSQSEFYSRSSITLHAIPNSDKFLHWHKHFIKTPTDDLGNAHIYRRKNQAYLKNRLVLFFESNFSKIFYWLKKNYIKFIHKQEHYR